MKYPLMILLLTTQSFAQVAPAPTPGSGLGDLLGKVISSVQGKRVTSKYLFATPDKDSCEPQAKEKAKEGALSACAAQFGSSCKYVEGSAAITIPVSNQTIAAIPVTAYSAYSSSSSDQGFCNSYAFPKAESNAKELCQQKYGVECDIVSGSTRSTMPVTAGGKFGGHVQWMCKAESSAKPRIDATVKFTCEAQATAEKKGFSFGDIKLPFWK